MCYGAVVGAPYLWGGKGWDFSEGKFVESNDIFGGYTYWDPDTNSRNVGSGLDCSGLVYWSFNKAAGMQNNPINVPNSCLIYYEGASGQWSDTRRLIQLGGPTDIPAERDLEPGDLLFLQNTETSTSGVDHVGMYVGDGEVVHAKGPEGEVGKIEKITLTDWLNLPTNSKNYRDHFAGYGRILALKRPNTNPQKGDNVIITASLGSTGYQQQGIITDIGNDFLCYQTIGNDGKTHDQCIGIGAISGLYWND